ncbi:MAG: hypothetical protein EPO21_02240 [Chloroflexota bacterium]|nr:MAG: hypothetical protein EPO21_02240 [Chloroflexota bacterium]
MLERAIKWLLPAMVVAEVVLVRAGLLDPRSAVAVVVAIEFLLLLVAGRQIIAAVRRYRRGRSAGLDIWAAVEDGLAVLLPRPVARAVALEPRIWVCLGTWLFRRGRLQEDKFRYNKRSPVGVLLIVVVITSPMELLLFELLIPWGWLRWVLLVAAVYMLVWAFGFYASIVTLPHKLEANGLRLRYGTFADALIPYEEIAALELKRLKPPKGRDGLCVARDENAAYLTVGGRTDLTLHLRAAHLVQGLFRPTPPVTTVHLSADEPERLARELERRVESSLPH